MLVVQRPNWHFPAAWRSKEIQVSDPDAARARKILEAFLP
jgi:hypothetical protein